MTSEASESGPGAAITTRSPVRADGVSDHTLLVGFAGGDANTGRAFVRRFQGRVYGVAISLLGDPGLAEEVAQEAFVRAWGHAAAYDPERGSVAAWLLRTTRNLAIDTLRRRRPQPLDPDAVAALTPASPATSVEDAAVTSDLTAQARAALARLPPKQAKALWLAAFCGHTAQQIALSESIPLGTAKTRIRQGLLTLRALLSDPDDTARVTEPAPEANPQRRTRMASTSGTAEASTLCHSASSSLQQQGETP